MIVLIGIAILTVFIVTMVRSFTNPGIAYRNEDVSYWEVIGHTERYEDE